MNTELEPVWTGSQGWIGANFGKGALLPPHNSTSTLWEAARDTTRAHGTLEDRLYTHPFKYDQPTRDQVKVMRANGAPLSKIARRLNMPLASVYNIVRE